MLTLLDPCDDTEHFPDVEDALENPDGLLAVGGCLSPRRLGNAYRHGIFPWYSKGEPILWWSPNPRLVLYPDNLKIARSLGKIIRRHEFRITIDSAFREVIDGCAEPRQGDNGTWITEEMKAAYQALQRRGLAHSAEAWHNNQLVGGLYGVAIGRVFFGESMFSRRSNASKVAFVALVEALRNWQYALIDCQVNTPHLVSFGADEISRQTFVQQLNTFCDEPADALAWQYSNVAQTGS